MATTTFTAHASSWHYGFPTWVRGKWHSFGYIFKITKYHMSFRGRFGQFVTRYKYPRFHPWGSATQDVKIYNTVYNKWKYINFTSEGHNTITYAYHPWGNSTTLHRGWHY